MQSNLNMTVFLLLFCGTIISRSFADSDVIVDDQRRECTYREFHCEDSSRCIPKSFLCDFDNDCNDGSDEKNCEKKPCSGDYFA